MAVICAVSHCLFYSDKCLVCMMQHAQSHYDTRVGLTQAYPQIFPMHILAHLFRIFCSLGIITCTMAPTHLTAPSAIASYFFTNIIRIETRICHSNNPIIENYLSPGLPSSIMDDVSPKSVLRHYCYATLLFKK